MALMGGLRCTQIYAKGGENGVLEREVDVR